MTASIGIKIPRANKADMAVLGMTWKETLSDTLEIDLTIKVLLNYTVTTNNYAIIWNNNKMARSITTQNSTYMLMFSQPMQ